MSPFVSEMFAVIVVITTLIHPCDCSGVLTEIPDTIPDDDLIYVSFNAIPQIKSHAFGNKTKSKKLLAQGNGIFNIEPEAFLGLDALEELNLGWNRIGFLHSSMFLGLGRVKKLILMHNEMSWLMLGVFQELISLESLQLGANYIRLIHGHDGGAFRGLKKLKYLGLWKNHISFYGSGLFSPLVSLETLDLSHNDIYILENGAFKGLGKIKKLKSVRQQN